MYASSDPRASLGDANSTKTSVTTAYGAPTIAAFYKHGPQSENDLHSKGFCRIATGDAYGVDKFHQVPKNTVENQHVHAVKVSMDHGGPWRGSRKFTINVVHRKIRPNRPDSIGKSTG